MQSLEHIQNWFLPNPALQRRHTLCDRAQKWSRGFASIVEQSQIVCHIETERMSKDFRTSVKRSEIIGVSENLGTKHNRKLHDTEADSSEPASKRLANQPSDTELRIVRKLEYDENG